MNPKPKLLLLLIALLVLLSLGGFFGGIAMFVDPSGESIGLPAELLDGLPLSTFLLPGLFLVVVMGIAPLVIAWGLWVRLSWAWIAALLQGILLVLWICFQILLWGTPIALQLVYLVWGLVLIGLCFAPAVKSYLGRDQT